MKKDQILMHKALSDLAALTRFDLTPSLIDFYTENLRPHGYQNAIVAIYSMMRRIKTWPTVVEIEEAMGKVALKPITAEDQARDAVSRIWEAIGKFGWCNPNEAKAHIGELGWKVVERFGGWSAVTDLEDDQRMGITAQMRELAISLQKFSALGIETGPSLPESHPLGAAMKILGAGKDHAID